MKKFDLAIDRFQAESFVRAVRTKRDVIVLWMSAIKAFLVNCPPSDARQEALLSIVLQSMGRLFCTLNGGRKIFSVAFPFNVASDGGQLQFNSREGVCIDNRVSSEILALIEGGGVLVTPDFSGFIDPIIDAVDIDPDIWILLRELMLAEDAYVRYDWDDERADGHRHPVHHLDLYYSSGCSFKIGLTNQIDQATLVKILDNETDCHYLHPAGVDRMNLGTRVARR